ncbi:MAG: hypothetical protein GWM92_14435 [Gemmatimonadetes bacterium]|nr:hypothetical protein [Gemmatimonadota bacterium]NIR79608.1 hypothetical protein [Gemmatimonadota bacterium]NIT88665.1 hypothetical protein [Gemmatimonadota bacterium]NIU32103.1 hypothetical protein [Gemmatimonadota bacterium]NIU36698.1 hypothetical protein [Gemmatimonadota bacterium]
MRSEGAGESGAGGGDGGRSAARRYAEQLVFVCVMGLLFLWAAWHARTFPDRSRIFPQVVAAVAFLLSLLAVARDLRAGVREEVHGGTPFTARLRSALPYLLWLGGYYAALWLLGFPIATGVFVVAFLGIEGELSWWKAALGAAVLVAVLSLLWWTLELQWPEGLIMGWTGLGGR